MQTMVRSRCRPEPELEQPGVETFKKIEKEPTFWVSSSNLTRTFLRACQTEFDARLLTGVILASLSH